MRNFNLFGRGGRRKTGMILFILAMGILFLMTTFVAEAAGPLYKTTRASKISNKFLRGVINIPLCFMEIPKAVNKDVQNTDYFTGTLTGLGEGMFKTSKRFCYGVFETVTFPSPELKTLDSWVDHPIPFKELTE